MWLLLAACVPRVLPLPVALAPDGLSDTVAAAMDRYPTDGSYGYYWPLDDGRWWGTTRDVVYRGLVLSPGDPDHRSHCVGVTWEIAMEVLQEQAGDGEAINGLGLADMVRFRKAWFVEELGGEGAAEAVVRSGVGVAVPVDQLRRGDFVQLWRGSGGHAGIFDGYEHDGERIVGIRYWSSHPMLGSIGYWTDLFPTRATAAPLVVYGARLLPEAAWRPPSW